jgi:hypothetical protein
LDRYLSPPVGPPLPVYYVFPIPHWSGPLTSRRGRTPGTGAAAPPGWWRQRAGGPWFGDWLFVMSAQSVAAALPIGWRKRQRAKLFALAAPHTLGGPPPWTHLLPQMMPLVRPLGWKPFWNEVTRCGPNDGVRWITVRDGHNRPNHVRVSTGDEVNMWRLDRLLDQPSLAPESLAARGGGNERALLHIPDSALALPFGAIATGPLGEGGSDRAADA